MFKSKKFVVLISSFMVLVFVALSTYLLIDFDKLRYGKTKEKYMTICEMAARKAFPLSRQALYGSCDCSYKKLNAYLGDEYMKKYVDVLQKQDKELTRQFIAENGISSSELDLYFFSCF